VKKEKEKFKKRHVLGVGQPCVRRNTVSLWDMCGKMNLLNPFPKDEVPPECRLILERID